MLCQTTYNYLWLGLDSGIAFTQGENIVVDVNICKPVTQLLAERKKNARIFSGFRQMLSNILDGARFNSQKYIATSFFCLAVFTAVELSGRQAGYEGFPGYFGGYLLGPATST